MFKKLWEIIKGSESIDYPQFKINAHQVLGEQDTKAFVAQQHYFVIRIVRQFLKHKRDYWKNYNPITIVLSEFIHGDKVKSFPFVVGPKLLAGKVELEDDENISYKNTRVAGPVPYVGDQIALFTGLFAMKTGNWAEKSLNLIQSVAGAFDVTKLTKYVKIAGPLLSGIEDFLGMSDMQLRLGQRVELTNDSGDSSFKLESGYWVMIRSREELDKNTFWMKDGVLYTGADASKLSEYRDEDYVIYSINCIEQRDDLTTFDFHKLFNDTKAALWNENPAAAQAAYREMNKSISRSDDLTQKHKHLLLSQYKVLVQLEKQKVLEANDDSDLFVFPKASVHENASLAEIKLQIFEKMVGDTIKNKDPKTDADFNELLTANMMSQEASDIPIDFAFVDEYINDNLF